MPFLVFDGLRTHVGPQAGAVIAASLHRYLFGEIPRFGGERG